MSGYDLQARQARDAAREQDVARRVAADDGGIWKLNPAVFGVKAAGVKQAALKWAQNHELKVKAVVVDGDIYLQFTKTGGPS